MVDMTGHLSRLNLNLQGKNRMCHDLYGSVITFVRKLKLSEEQLKTKTNSPTFRAYVNEKRFNFSEKISLILSEFDVRIKDLRSTFSELKCFASPIN